MYLLFALLSGVVLSVMIAVNGNLTGQYGLFPAAAVIHLVGSLTALALCLFQREKKPLWKHRPWWIYLGGAIGVFTTVFQNAAFGRISMTSIVALVLLGQTVASLAVDRLGLFGMARQPARKQSWFGLALALTGIAVMLDGSAAVAVFAALAAFASGISAVLSRTVNARLAEKTGALRGSLINHLVGLPITVVLALSVSGGAALPAAASGSLKPWMFCGGALGVLLVLLCNLTVLKISAFRMTLLAFVGQVFTGILLDVAGGGGFSEASFAGGVFIALGIAVNLIHEQLAARKEEQRRAYYAHIREIETAYRRAVIAKHPFQPCRGQDVEVEK